MNLSHYPLLNRLMALFVLMLFGLLLKLGSWQLARGEEKQLMLEQQQLRRQQPPQPLAELLAAPRTQDTANQADSEHDDFTGLPVTVSGDLFTNKALLLDNQHHQHQLGFHHLAPLQIQADQPLLLVDFGWLAAPLSRQELPVLQSLPEQLTLSGLLYRPRLNSFIDGTLPAQPGWPLVIQQIDHQQLGKLLQQPVYPWVLRLDPQATVGYVKQWPDIAIKPEKHFGYSVQWFAMALALAILSIVYLIRYRGHYRSSAHDTQH